MTLFGKSNSMQASVLIELLLSMFIVAGIFPLSLSLLKHVTDRMLRLYDKRIAIQRIASAESLLDYPIYYCGYAMPLDKYNYQKAFNYLDSEPFCWEGPISVTAHNSKNNALLKISYGKRGNAIVSTAFHYDSSNRAILLNKKHTENIKPSSSDFPDNVQNYILFASLSKPPIPLSVRKTSGNILILGKTIYDNFTISMNDPLFLFCAIKVYADNNILYSKDFRTLGVQPRVNNVLDMRFFLDLENATITIYTLVAGDIKFKNKNVLKLTNFAKDNENASLIEEWEKLSASYTLYASKKTWRLPNCVNRANYTPKNMD